MSISRDRYTWNVVVDDTSVASDAHTYFEVSGGGWLSVHTAALTGYLQFPLQFELQWLIAAHESIRCSDGELWILRLLWTKKYCTSSISSVVIVLGQLVESIDSGWGWSLHEGPLSGIWFQVRQWRRMRIMYSQSWLSAERDSWIVCCWWYFN